MNLYETASNFGIQDKRECQETFLSVGSVPILFCLGIQPNWLNVHSPSESGLAQA